jgi:23S rRNA (uracil1939-C5)-methyltransferase
MANTEVTVTALGGQGDGVAEGGKGLLYVPFSAPGDRLMVRPRNARKGPRRAEIVEILAGGPDRILPPCPHFTDCGGCSVQHIAPEAYQDWKRGIVVHAVERQGLAGDVVQSLVEGGAHRRRRARFAARRLASGTVIGFHSARSHNIVSLESCPVLAPEIVALITPLRDVLDGLLDISEQGEVAVTWSSTGADVTLVLPRDPDMGQREALVNFSATMDLARLSWRPVGRDATDLAETIVQRRSPEIQFGGISVNVPPDAFLQPTGEGEEALRQGVLDALEGTGKIVDFYAGCGAFSLPFAASDRSVLAIDYAADHLAALDHAARRAGFGERVTTSRRDLDRQPLMEKDLSTFSGVVLDPPRSGAAAQIRFLAKSTVPVIAYVSCNPVSFARDARNLTEGGYTLVSVTPVDQFIWSAHVELVAVFRR